MLCDAHRFVRGLTVSLAVVLALLTLSACTSNPPMPNDNDSGSNANRNDNSDNGDVDLDADGVLDVDDLCPGTAPEAVVDNTGCSVSAPDDPGPGQPVPDADDDGIIDANDMCEGTEPDAVVDDQGCSEGQRDQRDPPDRGGDNSNDNDNDNGSANDNDNGDGGNANTNDNQNDNGNANDNGNDNDNDNANDNGGGGGGGGGDPGGGGNDNGGSSSTCGNDIVEDGEDCEPPDSETCDADCLRVEGTELVNDECASPYFVTNGTIRFSTADATTDGPEEGAGPCRDDEGDDVFADIWFVYEATCDGLTTVSLCGSSYDTKVAVYFGSECPTQENTASGCSDDNCGLNLESRLTFTATQGDAYLIRIGGFGTDQGDGRLTIECGQTLDCQGAAGDCLTANGSRGCDDFDCCNMMCNTIDGVDRFCCDVEWDGICASEAMGLCNGAFEACETGTGDCFEAQPGPGCGDQDCCQQVCEEDPFCCLVEWDDFCVNGSGDGLSGSLAVCGDPVESCAEATGDCFAPGDQLGCESVACCEAICATDPFCCTLGWDETCAQGAAEVCLGACTDANGTCFGVHNEPGCDVPDCCSIICTETPECCLNQWGASCVDRANELRNLGQCGQ